MTRVSKIERDFAVADLANVTGLLRRLTPRDVLARMSLEARRAEIEGELRELEVGTSPNASAALFFGGTPVIGQRGIETEFASKAVGHFQLLVTKLYAMQEAGGLAERGPVANKAEAKLHITNIVRGSFGFLLEEAESRGDLIDTTLKAAVIDASTLMHAFSNPDEVAFQTAVETVDQRVLQTAREFFDLLKKDGATFRLEVGEVETSFGPDLVARAADRADATEVMEEDEEIAGTLAGLLPDGHMFELRSDGPRGTIFGRVSKAIPSAALEKLNRTSLHQQVEGTLRVKQVRRNGLVARESVTLAEIRPVPGTNVD